MKNRKYKIMSVAAVLAITLLLAGCSSDKKDTVTVDENTEVSSTYTSKDVDMDYILDQLQVYDEEIKSIALDQQITVPVSIPQGEEADIAVYKFVPDTSAVYGIEMTAPDKCGATTYISIVDQNANTLNEFPDTSASMIVGQQYFLVFYTESENPDKEVSFELNFTLKCLDNIVELDELKAGENIFTIEAEAERAAVFSPEESGYYMLDAHCLDSEYGTAAIDAVLIEGGYDIYGGQDLYYMEAGSDYVIIYGAYETGTVEAEVCIDIEPYDVVELNDQEVIRTDKNVIVIYTAKTDGSVLVYSVSDGDPEAVVYNQEFDVIAENKDADGELSDNDHDFAMFVNAEEGQDYFIVVDRVEGHACEIHLEEV